MTIIPLTIPNASVICDNTVNNNGVLQKCILNFQSNFELNGDFTLQIQFPPLFSTSLPPTFTASGMNYTLNS